MQIHKENVISGFKLAANLLKNVSLMFIHFFKIGTHISGIQSTS